jgi:glycosyltransferase involved in cell wall biosynthesis
MSNPATLVSIGLPVRNAGTRVAEVARSVLAQDHADLELLITDNASTDDTEEVCRELARNDTRISYHRQQQNIGLLNNFVYAIGAARGTYFRWIGDDDRLEPAFVRRCLEAFEADPRLLLVTTAISYTGPDGEVQSAEYTGPGAGRKGLDSDDPVDRLTEMLRLLNQSHLVIDPLYGMVRRAKVAAIPRRNMLREDEVFATKLALAGPWQHLNEVLAHRVWKHEPTKVIGPRLEVPSWQWKFATTLQVREMLRWIRVVNLTEEQRRRAKAEVYRMYVTRESIVAKRRARKLVKMATSR